MIGISLESKEIAVEAGTLIKELPFSRDIYVCGAFVNNSVKSTLYAVKEGDNVEAIYLDSQDGQRLYNNTLLFILAKAIKDVLPEVSLRAHYSLGGGLYCELNGMIPPRKSAVRAVKARMHELVAADMRINKRKMSLVEARTRKDIGDITNPHFAENNPVDTMTLYELDGYYGYFYTKMIPNTGAIKYFDLITYHNGVILLGDDSRACESVKAFTDQPNLYEALRSYNEWCAALGVSDVNSLNARILDGSITSLITVAEARHEQYIQQIAADIFARRDDIRLVLIAGPSSSGKTTTSKRLRTHLKVKGLEPAAVELDNYFLDTDKRRRDENGNIDLESIDCIDIPRLNADLQKLIASGSVDIPVFDFKTGRRTTETKRVTVGEGSPIIMEGIHGLNEKLTPGIAKKNKYKIYINDLTHLNIDDFNRIPSSDVRLIRRIVRDMNTRGHNAERTMSMWQSVTDGEKKNIYPFSSEADVVFNSSLFYELSVLKKYADPALKEISAASPCYHEAQRLMYILSFFLPIEDESAIYTSSVIREFIGGSVFENL